MFTIQRRCLKKIQGIVNGVGRINIHYNIANVQEKQYTDIPEKFEEKYLIMVDFIFPSIET